MTPRILLFLAFALALSLWAVAFAGSFAALLLTEATGDGFTRGLNRVAGFFGWQGAAAVLAVAIWIIGNRFMRGSLGHRLSRAPAVLAGLLAVGILGLVLWATLSDPAPDPAPTAPVTSPGQG